MYKTEFFTEFIDTGGDNCIIHVKSTSLQLTFKKITKCTKRNNEEIMILRHETKFQAP